MLFMLLFSCGKTQKKSQKNDQEEKQEANASLATAYEISLNAAVAVVLSELELRTALKAFLAGRHVSLVSSVALARV